MPAEIIRERSSKAKWRRLGHVFIPDGSIPWMKTHAAVPIVDNLEGDIYKVYFSSRDEHRRAHTGWITIDLNNPRKVLDISKEPVIAPGKLGAFDDSGSLSCCLVRMGAKRYLYYAGWNLGITVPFRNSIGLAISEDGGKTYRRYADGPIVDRTPKEPYFTGTSDVIVEKGLFKMWYQSCDRWVPNPEGGRPKHYYHIKYAESDDGINWRREGKVAIDFANDDEFAICCSSVLKDDDAYKMWFCYRGDYYRIGYAESADGIKWNRMDSKGGLLPSDDSWENEAVCYPEVFDHKGQRYMFYNGNDFGATGFGLAVLEHED